MKRDALIAFVAAIVVAALCYALVSARPPVPPPPTSLSTTSVAAKKSIDAVVMRVNGEAVTASEFEAAFAQLPEESQRQFGSPEGKNAFAEQIVKLKVLEQEAKRLGVDNDPKVAGAIAADRASILASAAAQKLGGQPNEQAIRTFYDANKSKFQTFDLSHIVIAYAGGMIPAKGGGAAPSEAEARKQAAQLAQQLKSGADFAKLALQYSADSASAERGGALGSFAPGMLPPEIEAQVFQLKEGQISAPIPSRFGIHIFKAGKRSSQTLEQLRPMVTQRVRQQSMLDRVEALRKAAKVDLDPKFFPKPAINLPPGVKQGMPGPPR